MIVPEGFKIHELVYPEIYKYYKKRGKLVNLWLAFDTMCLLALGNLRKRFGSILVNNWYTGGNLSQCGLRDILGGVNNQFSVTQHYFGRAFDCHFLETDAESVRDEMKKEGCFEAGYLKSEEYKNSTFYGIKRIEHYKNGKPISWFHFDSGNLTIDNKIYVINV